MFLKIYVVSVNKKNINNENKKSDKYELKDILIHEIGYIAYDRIN